MFPFRSDADPGYRSGTRLEPLQENEGCNKDWWTSPPPDLFIRRVRRIKAQQLITECRGQAGKGAKDEAWHWERVGGNHLQRAKAHDCRRKGVHYPFEYPGCLVAHYPHCHGGVGKAESNVEVPVGGGGNMTIL